MSQPDGSIQGSPLWMTTLRSFEELWVLVGSHKGKISFLLGDKERRVPFLFATSDEARTYLSSIFLLKDIPEYMKVQISAVQLSMVREGSLFVKSAP